MPKSRLSRRQFVHGTLSASGLAALGWPAVFAQSAGAPPVGQARAFLSAVAAGDLPLVRAMLGADAALVGTRDANGRSACLVAYLAGHRDVAAVLRERGHQLDLHEAAFASEWDLFDDLARQTAGAVDGDHPIGGTAMYAAALGGAGTDIWHVYQHAADVNRRADPGATRTPLRAAFDYPDLAVAELTAASMASNGARVDLLEPDGHTALHAAAERGSLELVEMLLRKGADASARDSRGRTPRDLADAGGFDAVTDVLAHPARVPRDHSTSRMAYDADGRPYVAPDLSDIPAQTREYVVGQSHSNLDTVREAVDAEPRLAHAVATTTERAVEACGHMGRRAVVDYLLDHGAPYSLPTAVMRNDVSRVRALLAEDPLRIHERGPHDFALLWYPVIGGGHGELATVLMDAGAEPETQHWMGTTALHWASSRGQVEMVELLIGRGADVNRRGRKFRAEGHTPLELARERDHTAVVDVLRRHGARG